MQVQISSAYPLSSAIPVLATRKTLSLRLRSNTIVFRCVKHLALDSEMLIHQAALVVISAEIDVITALIGDFRVARRGVKEGSFLGQMDILTV